MNLGTISNSNYRRDIPAWTIALEFARPTPRLNHASWRIGPRRNARMELGAPAPLSFRGMDSLRRKSLQPRLPGLARFCRTTERSGPLPRFAHLGHRRALSKSARSA